MKDVEAVNRAIGICLFDDGSSVEVDSWWDDSGDECKPKDATFAVARERDRYWSIDLSKFERTPTQ
jgi:hypothetical protein